ncbi:MAG: phosphate ABC transporter permease subunit PstC, partial [Microvirgula sp.]
MDLSQFERQLATQRRLDLVFRTATRFFAFLVLALLLGILLSLVIGAMPSIEKFGLGFLTSRNWDPVN